MRPLFHYQPGHHRSFADVFAQSRDLNFKYLAEGKDATVTAPAALSVSPSRSDLSRARFRFSTPRGAALTDRGGDGVRRKITRMRLHSTRRE
jgi:hypothetical protein